MSHSRFVSTAGPDAPDSVRFVESTKTLKEALMRKRELDADGSPYTVTRIFRAYPEPAASSASAQRFVVNLLHVEDDDTKSPPLPNGAKAIGYDLFAVPSALAAEWNDVCDRVEFVIREFSLERPPGNAK